MATKTVDVHESQVSLLELLSLARSGTEVLLVDDEVPVARLVPIDLAVGRVAGLHQGAIETTDDFDAPLPDEFWTGAL